MTDRQWIQNGTIWFEKDGKVYDSRRPLRQEDGGTPGCEGPRYIAEALDSPGAAWNREGER